MKLLIKKNFNYLEINYLKGGLNWVSKLPK